MTSRKNRHDCDRRYNTLNRIGNCCLCCCWEGVRGQVGGSDGVLK